jgi:alpha-galactosidase
LVLKLSATKSVSAPGFTYYSASTFALSGGAKLSTVNSSIPVAGYVGLGGVATISAVDGGSAGGTKTLAFDYINADFVFGWNSAACQNCRDAYVSVNGGASVLVNFPISGQVRFPNLMRRQWPFI